MKKSNRGAGRRSPGTRKNEKNNSIISEDFRTKQSNYQMNDSSRHDIDFDNFQRDVEQISFKNEDGLNRIKSINNKMIDNAAFQSLSSIQEKSISITNQESLDRL